ncbi:ribose-5-phosphate isomerase rki1 [Arthrobotrys megalospora]
MKILTRLSTRYLPKTTRLQARFQLPHYRHLNPSTAYFRTMATISKEKLIDSAKQQAAFIAVQEHYPKSPPKYIGIGSGSTIVYVVASIARLEPSLIASTKFIPTGFQSKQLLLTHGLEILDIDLLPVGEIISVAFDGADEVDSQLNCIKGGGACLFQEKIVAVQAEKFVVVADFRKVSKTLLTPTTWASGIPIEVVPSSYPYVTAKLTALGATQVILRPGGKAKAGPCVTDNGNFLLDAVFPTLAEGEDVVQDLAEAIKSIVGVVEHGLFYGGTRGWKGRPEVAYFGMEDGTVNTLTNQGWVTAQIS